jgi:hypothetical protein
MNTAEKCDVFYECDIKDVNNKAGDSVYLPQKNKY